jgi:hypothetical protein
MKHTIVPNRVLPDKVIANTEDRGTGDDPAWGAGDYTGGNDSGTSGIRPGSLDKPQGPDRTAELLQKETTRDLLNQPDPSQRPPTGSRPAGPDIATDESGRIASADESRDDIGGARNPAFTGSCGNS